jgi:hypothetical protein
VHALLPPDWKRPHREPDAGTDTAPVSAGARSAV